MALLSRGVVGGNDVNKEANRVSMREGSRDPKNVQYSVPGSENPDEDATGV